MRRGSHTVTAGLTNADLRRPVNFVALVAEGHSVKGGRISAVSFYEVMRCIGPFQAGRLPVDRLLGEGSGLEEISGAFDRLARGESIRQVLGSPPS